MTGISTHVLDTALGKPAQNLKVRLAKLGPSGAWQSLAEMNTNQDGRAPNLLNGHPLEPGTYRLTFDTGSYHLSTTGSAFYPSVDVVFQVEQSDRSYHVPLLLSPYGYSTYRGS